MGGQTHLSCVRTYNLRKTQEAHELLEKVLALSENERAEIAGNLISSLDTTVDVDADAAWQQEITRRLHEVQSGEVKTHPLGRGAAEGAHAARRQVSRRASQFESLRSAKYASVPIPIHKATVPLLSPCFRSFTISAGSGDL